MKTSIINIRVNSEIKNKLESIANLKEKALSEVVREALINYSEAENNDHNYNENLPYSIFQTLGFAEFIFWLYQKRFDQEKCESKAMYQQFIELINEMRTNPYFYPEILDEIDKVYIELESTINNNEFFEYFEFPISSNKNSFDYEKLADFMYTIRYEDDAVTENLFIK